jgi:hypothetical protein
MCSLSMLVKSGRMSVSKLTVMAMPPVGVDDGWAATNRPSIRR